MSLFAMGKCEQHPRCGSVRGEGVCPICLQTKLTHVWHGERRQADTTVLADPRAATAGGPVHVPRETLAIIGSIASIAKRTLPLPAAPAADNIAEGSMGYSRHGYDAKPARKPHPSFDILEVTEGEPRASSDEDLEAVIKDWAELHARRRNSQGKTITTTTTTDKKKKKKKKKRVTIGDDSSPMVGCYSRAGLPLVDRIAKETAIRVIKEVNDDAISVEDFYEDFKSRQITEDNNVWDDVENGKSRKQGDVKIKGTVKSFPGTWHSKIRAKLVKGLVTNSSKVFPSKSVENMQKRASPGRTDHAKMKPFQVIKPSAEKRKALRFNVEPTVIIPPARGVYESAFTSETVIEGMPDEILKPEDMNQRLTASYNAVLSWLQDLPSPPAPLFLQIGEPEEDPFLSEARTGDSHGEELAVVGYLHEIVEEHENVDSSEEELFTPNQLSNISSFGKFLTRAAERQPPRDHQGLARVVASAR